MSWRWILFVVLVVTVVVLQGVAQFVWARRQRRKLAAPELAEQFSAAVAEALGPVMVKLADAFNDFGRTYARAMTDLAEKLAAQHEQDRRDDLLDQR